MPVLADRGDAADWMRRLRDAALLDENGVTLDGALKTISTLWRFGLPADPEFVSVGQCSGLSGLISKPRG